MGESSKKFWKLSTAILSILALILIVLLILSALENEKHAEWMKEDADAKRLLHFETMNGVFLFPPARSSPVSQENEKGLTDVAVILNHTSVENTERWLNGLRWQRKLVSDLPVYIFSSQASLNVKFIKMKGDYKRSMDAVYFIRGNDYSKFIADVLSRDKIKFLIEIEDTHFMGADFADYYAFGRKIVDYSDEVDCVCGGTDEQREEHFQPSQGDLFWLYDGKCELGPMRSRAYFKRISNKTEEAGLSLRPEVSRVARNEQYVTRMGWHLDELEASFWRVGNFESRLTQDISRAQRMQRIEWDDLNRAEPSKIYMYPYAGDEDLEFYLGNDFQALFLFLWSDPKYHEIARIQGNLSADRARTQSVHRQRRPLRSSRFRRNRNDRNEFDTLS